MTKGKVITLILVLVILVIFGMKACHSDEADDTKKNNETESGLIDMNHDDEDEDNLEDEVNSEEDEEKLSFEERAIRNTTKIDGGEIDRTFEEEMIKKYGKQSIEQAKETAKEAIELWIHENPDESKWKKVATEEFYKEKTKYFGMEMSSFSDVKRKVTKLEQVISESDESDHLNISFNTEMDIVSNNKVITQQRLLYVVDMINNGEKWVVNNIIEYTNHLGNTE